MELLRRQTLAAQDKNWKWPKRKALSSSHDRVSTISPTYTSTNAQGDTGENWKAYQHFQVKINWRNGLNEVMNKMRNIQIYMVLKNHEQY